MNQNTPQSKQHGILGRLQERGLLAQCSHPAEVSEQLAAGKLVCYIGVDPTATSLHIGHLAPLMLLLNIARLGNKAIIIIGDGTAKIGDPTGKNKVRKMLTDDEIDTNCARITRQLDTIFSRLSISVEFVRNGDWWNSMKYIEFLRNIGSAFSVNHMLSFETYKQRLDAQHGLSFIEFNYMLLQSYDFLHLYNNHRCTMQIGGDDQWGNIVAGVDLIRRKARGTAYALTTPLLVTSTGEKMGKTNTGAVYLDSTMTSVFDFYQYWRNIDDADLNAMLLRFTELDVERIGEYCADSAQINEGKKYLAQAMTTLIHGEEAAQKIVDSVSALYSKQSGNERLADIDIPSSPLTEQQLAQLGSALEVFAYSGLCASKSEARRLIEQGGAKINGVKITTVDTPIDSSWLKQNALILHAGKKRVCKLVVSQS